VNYYWTVNGVPACQSRLTLDERLWPPTRCGHGSREDAQRDVSRVADLYPDARIEIHQGVCDRGLAADDDFSEAPMLQISVCEECPYSRDADPMPAYCAHPDRVGRVGGYGRPPTSCPLRRSPLLLAIHDHVTKNDLSEP
jgi:hypothetical protein